MGCTASNSQGLRGYIRIRGRCWGTSKALYKDSFEKFPCAKMQYGVWGSGFRGGSQQWQKDRKAIRRVSCRIIRFSVLSRVLSGTPEVCAPSLCT